MDLVVFRNTRCTACRWTPIRDHVPARRPEVGAFKQACIEHKIWGCFSIMEFNPTANPYNSGLIIDDRANSNSTYQQNSHP